MSTKMKIKVLFVDDEDFWPRWLLKTFGDTVKILHARTLQEADRLFCRNDDVYVIVVDDCLSDPGNIDTLEFVKEVRRGFLGIVIASCSDCNHGEMLVSVGCNEWVYKSRLHERLASILGLPQPVR